VHFPSAPTRTREILQQIDRIDEELRRGTAEQEEEEEGWDPELIWEPFPVSLEPTRYILKHEYGLDRESELNLNMGLLFVITPRIFIE
jgi:hypothetical protein